MADTAAPRVMLEMDHATGAGRTLVASDASTAEIRTALDEIDAAGWEELDSLETGDDCETDEHGRTVVPLVRIADGT